MTFKSLSTFKLWPCSWPLRILLARECWLFTAWVEKLERGQTFFQDAQQRSLLSKNTSFIIKIFISLANWKLQPFSPKLLFSVAYFHTNHWCPPQVIIYEFSQIAFMINIHVSVGNLATYFPFVTYIKRCCAYLAHIHLHFFLTNTYIVTTFLCHMLTPTVTL